VVSEFQGRHGMPPPASGWRRMPPTSQECFPCRAE
jgi:hypothetical protein